MKNRRMLLQVLLSMALVLSLIVPAWVAGASRAGPLPDDHNITHLAADSSNVFSATALNTPEGEVMPMVDAGRSHTVGLKADGTVVAAGDNGDGQCNVGDWTHIIQVAAGSYHTAGLRSDGTVIAVGYKDERCEVGGWADIIQVTAGNQHTVGIKSDGTVVAVGYNVGQCEVGSWTDIVQIAAGHLHTAGLKADGTVVAVGENSNGQCEVGGWTDIVQVAAGKYHTVGLKSDGTVVAVGSNGLHSDVGGWTDITQVAAGADHTVGLKAGGTVVVMRCGWGQCNVGNWTDIVYVDAGYWHTVGLKGDGTVVAVGSNGDGQCNVGSWNLVLALPASQCTLAISTSDGGWVSTPGGGFIYEGGFIYDEGTVVDLVATPGVGYRFDEWTGDVGTVADIYAAQTTITMEDHYAITATFELEEGPCSLTINSTEGGSVTTPGEGTFIYNRGTVVDLVAEAEEGYRLDYWLISRNGQEGREDSANTGATSITVMQDCSIEAVFEFVSLKDGDVGIKAGDWIKVEYEIRGWPAGEPYPEWLKLEVLSVEGTSATVRATMRMSDGTEQSDTVPMDVVAGGEAIGFSGGVIPANLTTGDSVYMTGYGDVTIVGETTRTYAGARRTVVYASISQSIPLQGEVQLTYYWDKLTGVVVEASTTQGDVTATAKATETNMWEASTTRIPRWLWVIIAVAVAAVASVVYRLRKRKAPSSPLPPPDGS